MLKSKIGLKLSITISIAFIVLVLFLTIIANKSSAATLTVDDDGNAKYMKIQDAIDAAGEGDTVRVYEGLYVENVVVGKTVSLVGNGSEVTTIDGGGSGDVVRITADWVNISGLSITGSGSNWLDSGIKVESDNNIISNNNCSNNHYGIYLYSSSYCTITNITMIENGIYIVGSLVKNWDSHTIDTTNTVNGKPVYYYKNISGFTVPYGTGQVILANCTWTYVENQNCSNGSVGILVGYSFNVTIENNTCLNNYWGIYIWDSNDCIITNNTCSSNNYRGIYLYSSSDCTITNNNCQNNSYGIFLRDSTGCTITNNTCSNNYWGIYLEESSACTVTNNTCSENNNNYGIRLYYSSDCRITNNTCDNNNYGISLHYSSGSIITNNTCSNNGYDGIHLYSSSYCTITNNSCSSNNGDGISLMSSSAYTITNNTCYSNNIYGIFLSSSSDCTVTNNTCSLNNVYGIFLGASSACTVTNNTCSSNNEYGIYIWDSNDCTITNNTCLNNNNGIRLYSSSDCTLENNTCSSNNYYGIYLASSSYCTLENNTISENRVGIYLESSSRDNTAHYNTIFNSTEYGINATDNNGYTINATNNWWGAASGPFHSSENPGGEGDNITDYVLFDPWLTEPGNHPPTANAGNNQTVYTNEEVRFMGTGDDPDGTIEKFEWDFDGDGTFDWSSLTTGETTHSYPLKGTYHAVLRVTDDKGATATDDCTITVNDNIKPTIMITSHANNSEISGKVTIKGTAADTDGTIEKVEISIDDGDWEIVNGIYSWDHEWDTTTLENGEYSLKFRAYDGTDFSEVKEIVLNVQKPAPENKKPTVSITSPKDGDKVKGKLTITGTSSGKNCTNRTYKLYQSFGNNDFLVSTGNLGSVISADYLLLDDRGIAVPGVQGSVKDIYGLNLDDEYTNVSFQDNDRDGRISSGDAFLVKNRINGGQAEADYSLVLKCNKVDKVEISINNGPWITVTGTESWSIEWDTKDIENGEYTIKVRSYDGKNYSDVKSITVKVENKDDDDGGGGFIPGFGAGLLVGAIGLTTILFLKRKKSRRVNYY